MKKLGVFMRTKETVSPMRYEIIANQIADKYFADKIDLKSLVKNEVVKREFTPQQIARLCQTVNIKIYQKLWEGSEDKFFEFEPVDYREIIQEFDMPEGPEERIKTPGKEPWDLSIGNFVTDVFWRDMKRKYGVTKPKRIREEEDELINQVVDTDTWGTKPSPVKIRIAVEKLEVLLHRLEEALRRIRIKMDAVLNQTKDHLKQDYLEKVDLNLPFTAVTRETGSFGERIFKDIVKILKDEGVIKEAAYEPQVRSDKARTSINPRNPIILQIHQLTKYKKDYGVLKTAIDRTKKKIGLVRSKMEA
jgi:hypothetical protein